MTYLTNDIINLRALEPEDLGIIYKWENNSEWWHFGNTVNPYSKFVIREYLVNSDKTIYENKQLRLMIESKELDQTIGMIDLYDFDQHNNRSGIGIVIDKEFQNKGFAENAIKLLVEYSFSFLGIHSLFAHIAPNNSASIKLFQKAGFQKTGTLKDWLRDKDKYIDVEVYQIFNT